MILKGNQRGGGRQLAAHLLNEKDNEHVHVHEMRGFTADDLPSAFHEAYGVSRGTRATQFLFSLSLSPPGDKRVATEDFEKAIDTVEARLGLQNQPRAIVFHEKEGRRHAHAVWSRIDVEEMKAINLPHYKLKLREVSKELYLEHGWQMPRGLVDSKERDPANFSHAEWQQAKRGGHDPKALKTMFQECWAISDSRQSFAQALKARGYTLARGDRRGHVAVDFRGEVYAVSKFVGVKAKAVKERLGDGDELPDVEQAKREHAERMTATMKRYIAEKDAELQRRSAALDFRRREYLERQRHERTALDKAQRERQAKENKSRAERYATGLRGLWDRVTGKHGRLERQNDIEALRAYHRDRAEKDQLIFRHIDERRGFHQQAKQIKARHAAQVAELHRDVAQFDQMQQRQATPAAEPSRERPERQRTPRSAAAANKAPERQK